MKKWIIGIAGIALFAASAAAHHVWGSYDDKKKMKVDGLVLELKYQNPHAEILIEFQNKKWTVILAPISYMERRGLKRDDIATGKSVIVEGLPRKDGTAEIRAERVIANGKTVELR